MPKTVGDLSKIIVAKGFKKSPKVQKIAKSGLKVEFIVLPRMMNAKVQKFTATRERKMGGIASINRVVKFSVKTDTCTV